ncbi:MAG TPA: RagB/SusD family nutrient uptake outer membrane protein [Chitinophagaceae bacterium]
MKNRIITNIFLITLISGSVSCKKLLDTKPKDEISVDVGSTDYAVIKSQIVSVYNYLQNSEYYGRGFIVQAEVLADNARITDNNSNRYVNEANNTPRSHVGVFAGNYQNILKANLVLANIDKSEAPATEVSKAKGEAYFLRALLYFDLIRGYARNPNHLLNGFDLGVPLITTPNLNAGSPDLPERAKVGAVYDQIIADLNNAITNLDNAAGRYKATKTGAYALLSRVQLYKGDWAAAETAATNAINAGTASLATPAQYTSTWGTPSFPENIFAVKFTAADNLGTNSIQYIFYRHPTLNGYGDVTASSELRSDFYTGDVRNSSSLLLQTTKSGQTVYYTLKYPGNNGGSALDDVPVLRLSEIYLNRAEARARKAAPDVAGALADLNAIHTRAGLTALAGLSGQALIDAILRERRLELAFEGHRIFDLLRNGLDVVKTPATISYSDYRLVAPIPQGELDVNKNLVQNPGY